MHAVELRAQPLRVAVAGRLGLCLGGRLEGRAQPQQQGVRQHAALGVTQAPGEAGVEAPERPARLDHMDIAAGRQAGVALEAQPERGQPVVRL